MIALYKVAFLIFKNKAHPMKSRYEADPEFKKLIIELHEQKYNEKPLSFEAYLSEFLSNEVISAWKNREDTDISHPLKNASEENPDDIIRKAIKKENNFYFVAAYLADVLNEYQLLKYTPSNFNKYSTAGEYICLGLTKKKQQERILNLSGSGIYPCNLSQGKGFDNIFYNPSHKKTYDNLYIGLKLTHPEELNLSNIWVSGVDRCTDYEVIPKAIVAARPVRLCMRNTAILQASSVASPGLGIILNNIVVAIAIAEVDTLDLSWNLLASKSGSLFRSLQQNKTRIKNLDISYNFADQFLSKDWKALRKLINHNQITHLNMAGNFFTNEFHEFNFDDFLSVVDCDSLREIDLSQNSFHKTSDYNWQKLINILQKRNFKKIWLDKPIPEHEGCSIKNHFMTVKKDWGTTTVSMAAPSLNGGDTYSIEKNKLTLQRKKDIQQITKWDLQEQAAFAFWETSGANIGYHNGMFFAGSEKCKVAKIEPGVAKILCEYADVEPDEWDENTYQANTNPIKL